MPFIIITIIAILWFFWFIYILVKKKSQMGFIEPLLTSTVIVVFSIQPSIADSLLSLISCQQIGNTSYLTSYLIEECYTKSHIKWLSIIFLPFFLLYGFIMPFLAMAYMFYYKDSLYESIHIKKVGFLSIGYSYNKFYWEFIFFYRKILLIFIIKYISWSASAKALLMILFLWVSLWYQAKDNPYLTSDLNSVDFKATFVSFVTIFAGLLSFETQRIGVEVIVIIVVFFFNLLFLYYWIRRMLIIKLPLYINLKYLKCLQPFFTKMLPEYNQLKAQALRVNLMKCMSTSVKKNENNNNPSNAPLAMVKEFPRKTVFSHFKDALSKLITNAADENQRNSRFVNTSDEYAINRKNKSFINLLPITPNSMNRSNSNLSESKNLSYGKSIHLRPCENTENAEKANNDNEPVEPVESEIEMSNIKNDKPKKLNKPNFDDDSMQVFSADRKANEDEMDEIEKKKKNLLDREIVETSGNDVLKKMAYSKIEELNDLYDEMFELRKEIEILKEKNKKMENNLISIKKHPISHKLSSIKRLETRKNNVYFQEEKPKNQTFTSPSSDITKKPHFLKHAIEKKQIYKEWVRNNSELTFLVSFLGFKMMKETFSSTNIIKINCQIRNEITQKIDGLSIKMTTTKSYRIFNINILIFSLRSDFHKRLYKKCRLETQWGL